MKLILKKKTKMTFFYEAERVISIFLIVLIQFENTNIYKISKQNKY